MRAREFIVEYKRDETAKRLGSRLVTVEPSHTDVDEILARLEAMDPTPNKKYTQWIAQQYITKIDGHLQFRLEDAPRIKQTLERFEQIKRNLPQKDINKYTYYALEDTVDSAFDVELQEPDQKPQAPQQTYEVPDDADVLYNGPLGLLTIPRTREASCALGKGTSWCTARTDDGNEFDHYNEDEELYIWHDKSGKKYQFHFGSDMQFMNQKNRPIDRKTMRYFKNEHPVLKKLFARKESESIKDPRRAAIYARNVIGGRWPEAESVIARGPYASVIYATSIIKGRWPEAEAAIAKDAQAANWYAQDVIGGRWPEGERAIAQDPDTAVQYAKHVIKGRWPEAEAAIAQGPKAAYSYSVGIIHGRWPEGEPAIAQDPESAYDYAESVLERRWPEAEDAIAQDPYSAYYYALRILHGRFPKAEPAIAQDPQWALEYARSIIKGPWPEGEDAIAQSGDHAYLYAKDVIKGRWPKGEPAIARSLYRDSYYILRYRQGIK